MANRDITEGGVKNVLETMGIPTSFQGLKENVVGRAETLATLGSGMAGAYAGMGGGLLEMMRSGRPDLAIDEYQRIQEAMTYMPRTQGGIERVQAIGEFLEPVANVYEQYGQAVGEESGYPIIGEFAQEFVDPLDMLGLGAVSAIPMAARKGSRFAENVASQTTQRANTVGTAVKASNYLDEIGAKGKTLDYGAGLGENAKAINADETFEPFPQGEFSPTYTNPADVPANSYGRIVSTNVLNVLPPDIRLEAVQTIGKALEPGGTALIQTWDVGAAKAGMKSKKATPVPDEENAYTTSTGSYQKGFSKQELQEYIADTLGRGYLVEPVPNKAGISGTAVTIKKIADPSVQVDLGIPDADLDAIVEQAITAYHGSAADFDKFDLDFIGTGEGAQAYGYGLYFAEAEKVAEGYKEALTGPRVLLDNKPLGDVYTADIRENFKNLYDDITDEQIEEYANMFADAAIDLGLDDADAYEAALDYLKASKAQLMEGRPNKDIDDKAFNATLKLKEKFGEVGLDEQMFYDLEGTINDIDGIIANLGQGGGNQADFDFIVMNYLSPEQQVLYDRYMESKIKFDEPEGAMYEVRIKAAQDELLNYDKPFSEQSEKVQKAIKEVLEIPYEDSAMYRQLESNGFSKDDLDRYKEAYERRVNRVREGISDANVTGSHLYDRIADVMGTNPKEASDALKRAGVKGIKYSDGLSRNKEGGTSNFVVFDPRIIDIAKKYGVAIPVAGYILSQAEGQQQQQQPQA